jgi:hypothetical protein
MELHIDKLSVDENGLTQLVELLGRDCTPTQFVREFIKNSDEAVARRRDAAKKAGKEYDGQIRVDVDWKIYEKLNQYKMAFIDNGDGMTSHEMIKHLNNLSSSGHENVFKNYGMGAKIASLTRNHEGIIYQSWKDGVGSQIVIKYDASEGSYGIVPVDIDGNTQWSLELEESEKPDIITDSGTQVTLFGMDLENQDTMHMPTSGTRGGRENWLYQYINTRFYEVTEDTKIKVRVGYWRDRENKKHNYLRVIAGQSATLDKYTINRGELRLSDAKIHWRILKEDRDSGHGREYLTGHTGCLNQGELFDLCDGRSNRAPDFGIYIGKEDISLIVEPNTNYVQNTARTGLVHRNGSELPWLKWAEEFRKQMPVEIEDFIKKRLAAIQDESHSESIQAKLKSIAQLFKLSRFRKNSAGSYLADPNNEVESKTGEGSTNSRGGDGNSKRSTKGGYSGAFAELLLSGTKEKGVNADTVQPDKFPECIWSSTKEYPELEDRAARYLTRDNKIIANNEFQGFIDVREYFLKTYPDVDNAEEIITPIVRGVFEQQLVETVTGALSFQNRPKWTPKDFEHAISPEALSTAVMSRYYLINQIKRDVGSKLGKAKTELT